MLRLTIDTETTGLDPAQDMILEVAFYGGPGIQFQRLLLPTRPMSGEDWRIVRRISGILPWDLLGEGETAARIRRPLLQWYRGLGSPPIDGWNLPFDRGFLEALLPGIPLRWGVCRLEQVRVLLGRRIRLDEACRMAGIPRSGAHRALADARDAWALGEYLRRDPFLTPVPILLPEGRVVPNPIVATHVRSTALGMPQAQTDVLRRIPRWARDLWTDRGSSDTPAPETPEDPTCPSPRPSAA